jgi:hypothetical protein
MRSGQVERRTHDYRRHGTTTLFAALNVKTSELINAIPSTASLDRVQAVPRRGRRGGPAAARRASDHGQLRHPQTPLIRNWLAKRPRVHVHFTPTYRSWLRTRASSPLIPISSRAVRPGPRGLIVEQARLMERPTRNTPRAVHTRETQPDSRGCTLWSHMFGWEQRLEVKSTTVRTQVAREFTTIERAADEWRRAMIAEGWSSPHACSSPRFAACRSVTPLRAIVNTAIGHAAVRPSPACCVGGAWI